MNDSGSVRVSADIPGDAAGLLESVLDDVAAALQRDGIEFEARTGGRIMQGALELGRIVSWNPAESVLIEWRPPQWQPDAVTNVEFRIDPIEGGTRIMLELRGFGGILGSTADLSGWFATEIVPRLLGGATPARVGDWITDRHARRPSGAEARAVYRDPLYHYPNFRVILAELALTPTDHLLEVGCGGGALLADALKSGCSACGIDHSADMVRVARETNPQSIAQGRLRILQSSAESLPFADGVFTCAAMTGVLGFLSEPVSALAEILRVLRSGGRLVVLGSDPELRGGPGAPEPMASRLRFYDDNGLADLARSAGFAAVHVLRRDLESYAREVGVPEEHLPLFSGPTTRFLLARKD